MQTSKTKVTSNRSAESPTKAAASRAKGDKETAEQYAERAEARNTPGMKHGKKAMQDRTETD